MHMCLLLKPVVQLFIKAKAHEICKLGTSLIFRKSCTVQQVLNQVNGPLSQPLQQSIRERSPTDNLDSLSKGPVMAAYEVV